MTAEVLAPEISELLTWDEICSRYPDEWVCLVDMECDHPDTPEIRKARVIGHGKTRRAPVDQAMHWRDQYEEIGYFFTGRITSRPLFRVRPRVVILDDET
jgi:hypothetical protein